MKNQHSGTYKVPTQSPEEKKAFDSYCSKIKEIQKKLTENPNLAFMDVNGYAMSIVNLRRKAKQLNQKFRLRREVP